MGFGTLFIGYFLLLNLTYFQLTDLISALLILYALYKLSLVSSQFKLSYYASYLFVALGFAELPIALISLITGFENSTLTSALSIVRAVVLCVLTLLILQGIGLLAKELKVERVPTWSQVMIFLSGGVYLLQIFCESARLASFLSQTVISWLYITVLIGWLLVPILNLIIIYTCYMRIGLPDEDKPKEPKPSRFAFVNEYRRRRAEKRAREEEDYRREMEAKKKRRKKK